MLAEGWKESGLFAGAFLCACAFSFILAVALIRVAHRWDFLDYPTERKAHSKPMPYLGGIGTFISFWSVVFGGIVLAHILKPPAHQVSLVEGVLSLERRIFAIFLGSLVILVVGFFDDRHHWNPAKKLFGQILATFVLMSFGLTINLFQAAGMLGYIVTFIWVLLMMNAFNFIDSLDGHCTGVALISTLTFLYISQIIHQPLLSIFLVTFAGALFGFLPHNFRPAKMFLGDNGSLFIGYMMAAFTLLCNYQTEHATYATLFIPLLVFGVPIYDTISVVTVRTLRGIPPWRGDRNHFAHRLVKIGMSDRAAVIFSYFISWTTGLLAILMTQVRGFGAALIGIIFVSILAVIAFLEFYAVETIRLTELLASRKKRRRSDIQQYREEHGE